MSVDREQIRRDAEERQFICQCAAHCLALLTELEQAETSVKAKTAANEYLAQRCERAE